MIPPNNGYNVTDDLLAEVREHQLSICVVLTICLITLLTASDEYFFKLEGYGDCLVDEEDTSMCSHNITTVVTELGFDPDYDAGLVLIKEMWPQGLTASDPLTDPPSKAVAISSASTVLLITTCLTFLAL